MRSLVAGLLVLVTCILLLASVLAVGSARTVLDTDRVAAAVDAGLSDPVVVDALSAWVGEQTAAAIEDSGVVQRALPDDWDVVGPVLERAVVRLAVDEADRLVRSPRVHELVVEGARRTHAAVLRVLEGDRPEGGLVVVQDGRVDLNLLPVVARVLARAQELGLPADVDLPELSREMTVAEQNAALGDALGIDLRDDLGQLTVYERDAGADRSIVRTAQRGLEVARTALGLLVGATVLLAALALVASPRRLHTAAWLAGGSVAGALLARTIVDTVVASVPDALSDPGARAAAAVILDELTGGLGRTVTVLAAVSAVALVVLVAAEVLSADARRREQVRRALIDHADLVRAVTLALAVLVLLVGGLSLGPLVVALALAGSGWILPGLVVAGGRG